MVYEMRVYTLQPGKVAALRVVKKAALPVISKYSKLVGWWSTEVGPLNEVVHIWALTTRITANAPARPKARTLSFRRFAPRRRR